MEKICADKSLSQLLSAAPSCKNALREAYSCKSQYDATIQQEATLTICGKDPTAKSQWQLIQQTTCNPSYIAGTQNHNAGNSSTSNTCNPIYIAGRILQLQITMEFHRQLIHQHHLQSHLHCGNDPTVANHNGILSTAHGRNTVETPFTMRNRSEHDPTMIRG